MAFTIIGTMSAGIIILIRTITEYILKKKLIDKNLVKEGEALFRPEEPLPRSLQSLKWALVLGFGGASLIILAYTNYDYDSPLPIGMIAVGVALGFLMYYFVAKAEIKKRS